MTIANYISDLLYRYECVVLPGFGAILTNRKPAHIHPETHTFNPPRKTLSFNGQLIQNDGLLVNYISETEKISYNQALEKIQSYVFFLESELNEKKEFEIENVGCFKLSAEEKITFQPNQQINYLTEAFGLSSYTSVAINRTVETTPEAIVAEQHISQNKRQAIPYLKYAAIGLIALGIAGFGSFQFYNQKVTEHNIAEQQEAESKIQQEIQQATFLIDHPLPTVKLQLDKKRGKFHVVAGAFRIKENAEKKAAELKKQGYEAKEIGANSYGLHQVIYNSYNTRSEALQELRTIKKSVNNTAWLLVQEL